ncbi:MAG: hypothetical protein QXU98_07885 [Candidatus Parvarchaeota archaeon]
MSEEIKEENKEVEIPEKKAEMPKEIDMPNEILKHKSKRGLKGAENLKKWRMRQKQQKHENPKEIELIKKETKSEKMPIKDRIKVESRNMAIGLIGLVISFAIIMYFIFNKNKKVKK